MNYRRALVIRFGGLGDILLATPTIRALRATFPGMEIDVVVGDGMADAIAGHPCVRNVYVFDKRLANRRPNVFVPFLRKLARARYDLVVNLHPSAKSYVMAYATRAPHQLTFRKNSQIDPATGRVTHAIDDFAKVLKMAGCPPPASPDLDFIIPDEARRNLDDLLRLNTLVGPAHPCGASSGISSTDRLVVINPAASRPVNRWPAERFQRVAKHFAECPSTTVVITGAPRCFRTEMDQLDEVALARRIASIDEKIVCVAGLISIKELGALLARASAFLTCDTGPMHVAAALKTPMVVLSGSADPDRTGPLVDTATILIDRTLPCAPCRSRECVRGDLKCMDNLTVDLVIDALERRLPSCPEATSLPGLARSERFATRVLPVYT